ncbi:MAG: glycosyltransferase [Candidatus Brocadiaceae bacterium]|jgi:glycosyltransferase involved in cell wall biosynthesis
MNVLHINTTGLAGGASRALWWLHVGLREEGHRSRMLTFDGPVPEKGVHRLGGGSCLWRAAHWLNRKAEAWTGLDGLLAPQTFFFDPTPYRRADIINLRNLHGHRFSLWALPRLERFAPLLWRLPDMWPLTGGCVHPMECTRWLTGCGQCVHLRSYPTSRVDHSALVFRAKRLIYSRINPVIVTPSEWLRRQVQASPLMARFRVHAIPNGVDLRTFRPVDRAAARASLGLREEEKVILFAAHNVADRLKGGDLLLGALSHLRGAGGLADVRLMTVGERAEGLTADLDWPVLDLGMVHSDRLLAAAYSAADVFVGPSRAESFGLVFAESAACGLPAVAFRTTAIPGIVRHGRTGLLARPFDVRELARNLHTLLTDTEVRDRMSSECRAVAESEFDYRLMTGRYLRVYEEKLEERARRRAEHAPEGGDDG